MKVLDLQLFVLLPCQVKRQAYHACCNLPDLEYLHYFGGNTYYAELANNRMEILRPQGLIQYHRAICTKIGLKRPVFRI
jgi:hypothetical protein